MCLGCSANYVGKTERTLFKGYIEHAWCNKGRIFNIHLTECNRI